MASREHRSALRRRLQSIVGNALSDVPTGARVIVGCSGGADSLALARIVADLSESGRVNGRALIVDHQLQAVSAAVAANARATCRTFGMEADVVTVSVDGTTGLGPEGAARQARRAAFLAAARTHEAMAVLLAHTRDDQAETVLLRLVRGSGTRSMAGIAPADGLWRRPLLAATREDTQALCRELEIEPFRDPHNSDPAYTRVRVRHTVLPLLRDELGKDVVDGLARTAVLARADNEALDQWAALEAEKRVILGDSNEVAIMFAPLERIEFKKLPLAIRTRIVRLGLLAAGVPPNSINMGHVGAVDRLMTDPRVSGPTRVPGDREVVKTSGKVVIAKASPLHS